MSKSTCEKGHKTACAVCARIRRYHADPAYRAAQLQDMAKRYRVRKAKRTAAKVAAKTAEKLST